MPLKLRRLRRLVVDRGGLCEIWLVYVADRLAAAPDPGGSPQRPRLVRAFWSRLEAVEWAKVQQWTHRSFRYEVYHVPVDETWVADNCLRPARYVSSVDGGGPTRPSLTVSPGAIAQVFGQETPRAITADSRARRPRRQEDSEENDLEGL